MNYTAAKNEVLRLTEVKEYNVHPTNIGIEIDFGFGTQRKELESIVDQLKETFEDVNIKGRKFLTIQIDYKVDTRI